MNVLHRLLSPFWEAQGLPNHLDGAVPVKDFDPIRATFPKTNARGIPPDTQAGAFTQMYSINATVFRCVNVISSSLANLPRKVYDSDDEKDRRDITASPDFMLLQKPTDFMSGYDFWEWTSGFLELQGEAFIALKLSVVGKILEMIPIRPDKITIVPDPETRIAGYVFTSNTGKKFPIQPEEMIYLHYWSPNSDFRGQSRIMAAESDLNMDLRAVSANLSMLKQGARPSGVVSTKDHMTEEQYERFKEMVVDQYEGQLNQGKIMFLEGDAKWHAIGLKAADMQYIETRKWTKDTVGEVLGVPPLLRMDMESSSVLQNTQAQKEVFWEHTMIPITTKLAAALNLTLIPRLTNVVGAVMEFDLSKVQALQTDRKLLSELTRSAVETGGMTPAQATMLVFGIENTDPNANILYMKSDLVPLGTVPEPEQRQLDVTVQSIDNLVKQLEGPTDEIKATHLALEVIHKSQEDRWDNDQKIKGANAVDRVLNALEPKFTKAMQRLFDDQSKEILRNLRASTPFWGKANKDLVTEINFSIDEWIQIFEDEGKPFIAEGLRKAGEELADGVGGTYDVNGDVRAAGFINTEARTYASQVNSTTQIKIDAILRSALASNLSVDETASLITRYFVESATVRAKRIARTELVRATNNGRKLSMIANGFAQHMWVSQRDARVRDEHISIDGEVVDIGKSFSNGLAIPQEINCRCYTIPQREKK